MNERWPKSAIVKIEGSINSLGLTGRGAISCSVCSPNTQSISRSTPSTALVIDLVFHFLSFCGVRFYGPFLQWN